MFNIPENVRKALDILHNSGYEAFIVGGCVRDYLLGNEPKDIDITTNARPEQVETAFKGFHVIETGIQHGTVTVVVNKEPIEITTYRIEAGYSDNRHPDKVYFTASLRDDASRRDFTINAMAYSDETGIVDYFDGQTDLNRKLIRCVGNAVERFDEDGLRILRALRFASALGFEIEEKTGEAIHQRRELLKNISSERIAAELKKTLCGKNVKEIFTEYADVFSVFIPEIENMIGFEQLTPYHVYDVFEHTMHVVNNIEPVPHLRLAALLHDIGKPLCRTIDENGVGHFKGHANYSLEIAERVLKFLKLDNFTIDRVLILIKHHSDVIEPDPVSVKKKLNKLSPEVFFDLLKLKRADDKSKNPENNCGQELFDRIEEIAEKVIEEQQCFSLKDMAVNGKDLLAMGFKGKMVGIALEFLLTSVIENRVENEKQALIEYLRGNLHD